MAQVGEFLTAEQAMRLALAEARKGVGFVAPNPLVGCVIVDREHKLVASGYHKRIGFDHAEIDALKNVKDKAQLEGATFYVTLEPCAHEGRTPSCAKALAQLPLAKVVYGLQDPNPLVAGKGAGLLRAAGIAAIELKDIDSLSGSTLASLGQDVEDLAEIFLRNMRAKSPFVAVKVATSLDGMMAMDNGESQWITGEESRQHAHLLRAHYDAVLIGRNTFQCDDPSLNVRLPGFENHRNKVVLIDPSGKTLAHLAHSNLLRVREPTDVYVVVSEGRVVENPSGVNIMEVETDSQASINVQALLESLYQKKIGSVFIEGGARTFGSFLEHEQVQRLHLFVAPVVMGARHGVSWTRYCGGTQMDSRAELKHVQQLSFGRDIYVTGRF